ncbi:uncharacterized protein LOC110446053 [Mizuhopecten yessoensis]|uniref:uncharacterized protein LOC110446053 n=1 Tax=Mizuhopecten yessoensis TaxID=6573 RepID=UPI000B458293|nr:uncharacterized protein LOC110446053 [Mizuhopecten yessoensis]
MMPGSGLKLTVLLVTLFANIFDVISDWLFYTEQLLVKDGLVFGPFDHELVKATYVICIIASVTFLMEFVFDFVKFFTDSDTVELVGEIVTVITLLMEDLPQTGINLHIALCRDLEATNAYQIVKASTAIFEVLVKLIFICIPFCRNKCKTQKRKCKLRKPLKIVTITLLIVYFVLSTVVLSATTFHKSDIKFYSEGLDREDTEHYLQDVGVFMRLQTTHPTLPKMAENQWMMLTHLTNITDLSVPTDGLFLSVIFTTVPLQYIWARKHFPGRPKSLSCYEWNSTSSILLPQDKCSDIISSTTNTTTVSMRFTYVPPSTNQPMGDIHYNSEISKKFDHILTNKTVTLKYFKVKSKVKGNLALTTGDSGGQYRFYNDQTDLQSVREVWKKNCANTGRESPKLDTNMLARCVF